MELIAFATIAILRLVLITLVVVFATLLIAKIRGGFSVDLWVMGVLIIAPYLMWYIESPIVVN